MLPTKLIVTGLILLVGGAAVVIKGNALGLSQDMALNIGALLVVLGLFGFVGGLAGLAVLLQPPKGVHREDGAALAMGLIRAMLAVSIADGRLDDKEILTVSKIYKQLTGSEMAAHTIRHTADEMLAQPTSIGEEMLDLKDVLSGELKLKVIRASLYILAADGKMEAKEENILEEIRLGLGISAGKVKSIKNQFLKQKGLAA